MPIRCLAVVLFLGLMPALVSAQQASLVTYGPGSEVWELFGHNSLWLQDPETGLDHTFSFGYFDPDRPGFHQDFVQGIMPYFGAASQAEREFSLYQAHDRSIRVQRLKLSPKQVQELFRLLDEAIFPQPQYYDYHYYLANCSTRLRDLLDQVVGGRIADQLKSTPEHMNFRDHTRRLTRDRFWIHTGIMLLLGSGIDVERSAWDESFLPDRLAEWLGTVDIDGMPLVLEDEVMYVSRSHDLPLQAGWAWPAYAGLGLFSVLLILGAGFRGEQLRHRLPGYIGLVAVSLAGTLVLIMWLGTGHEFTWRNGMALLLNPLWLVFLLPGLELFKRLCWWFLVISVSAGTILLAWPDGPQYRLDQLLWLSPMCAALLIVTARWRLAGLAS